MGNETSKNNFRKTFMQLLSKTQPVDINDDDFWNQFWNEYETSIIDIFDLIAADEIKLLREESPNNIATFCYKAVEKLSCLTELQRNCATVKDRETVLNCVRILTRLLPFLMEDGDWRSFFWSCVPTQPDPAGERVHQAPLAYTLMAALTDLLFFPDFTVSSLKPGTTKILVRLCRYENDIADDSGNSKVIDSCEYIWQSGVGFSSKVQQSPLFDKNRTEILKLLLTCFSETMYIDTNDSNLNPGNALPITHYANSVPNNDTAGASMIAEPSYINLWIKYFTGMDNRHALPLFTSLLNTVFSYDPVGYGVPYNHLMFRDAKEPLMEVALQILCVTLENMDDILQMIQKSNGAALSNVKSGAAAGKRRKSPRLSSSSSNNTNSAHNSIPNNVHASNSVSSTGVESDQYKESIGANDNLFIHYMSRIHRDEDFAFILNGFIRLLNNPLSQTYLPGSTKRVQCHQELLILLWRMCDINRRFLFYLLKSSHILQLLVPILYHLNAARSDQSKIGLVHMGVFILLMLSGERNFGVRLNKPYDNRVAMDIPVFTGTHADLLIIVFHKVITSGHNLLQPLFDCLLTVIVNISPYLKSLSMVTSNKLLHLLEAFTSPWFLLSSSSNHHLVFFLLEILNNIIQYQFDGNSNLIYCIIRKRLIFFNLVNMKTDQESLDKIVQNHKSKQKPPSNNVPKPTANSTANNAQSSSEITQINTDANIQLSLKATPPLANMTTSDYRKTVSEVSAAAVDDSNIGPLPPSDNQVSPDDAKTIEAETIQEATSHKPDNESAPSLSESQVNIKAATNEEGSCVDPENGETEWAPTTKWMQTWKQKLPLQTIMRLLQVLVPQVEKLCIEKGLTDESEILKFLQHGTLVGLLPVPHPILIRKYQANAGTNIWFRTYMWGVIYLRNRNPPIWYDTNVRLFEIQKISDN